MRRGCLLPAWPSAKAGDSMRLAQHAASSLEAVDDLINTLLELSRIDAGACRWSTSHFHLDQLLRQLSIEFSPCWPSAAETCVAIPCRWWCIATGCCWGAFCATSSAMPAL
jgi:signal transduction histidine kinase